MTAIEITALHHRYPQSARDALAGISCSIPTGARVGLLGPNGAGKTTLMRLLCGGLAVQGGAQTRVSVVGFDVRTDSLRVRQRVGYLPEQVPLYPELRVSEHLGYRAALKGVKWRATRRELARVVELTGLEGKLEMPIGHLSRGYRQRVGLADALLGDPALVVLDEPTVGLDPNQVQEIRAMLRDMGGRQTLVFSSHILAEVEMLCDRVLILSQGKLVVDESLDEAMRAARIRVGWSAPRADAQALLDHLGAVEGVEIDRDAWQWEDAAMLGGSEVSLRLPPRARAEVWLAAVGAASRERGLALTRLEAGRSRLEERFTAVTTGAVVEDRT